MTTGAQPDQNASPQPATPSPTQATSPEPAEKITLTMPKNWRWGVVLLALGLPTAGGGVVNFLSAYRVDGRVDGRVDATLSETLDKKLDEKLSARLTATAAAAEKASASASATADLVTKLSEVVVRQGAEAAAQARLDSQARQSLEQRVADHEDRLRQLERGRR